MTTNEAPSYEAVDYEALDPGIRKTVALLRGLGYQTCDSGDGKTKYHDENGNQLAPGDVMECALPWPNVFILATEETGYALARKLAVDVEHCFHQPGDREEGVPGWGVDVTWDLWSGQVLVGLIGIDDSMLKTGPV